MKKLSYIISLAIIALVLAGCGTSGCCNNTADNCCGNNSFTGNWY